VCEREEKAEHREERENQLREDASSSMAVNLAVA
jgi:hypothetical protein